VPSEIVEVLQKSILELVAYQKQINNMLDQKYKARSKLSAEDIEHKVISQKRLEACYEIVKKLSEKLAMKTILPEVLPLKNHKPQWDDR
jgi:hypothetical protein